MVSVEGKAVPKGTLRVFVVQVRNSVVTRLPSLPIVLRDKTATLTSAGVYHLSPRRQSQLHGIPSTS